jgi:hypothetical protein
VKKNCCPKILIVKKKWIQKIGSKNLGGKNGQRKIMEEKRRGSTSFELPILYKKSLSVVKEMPWENEGRGGSSHWGGAAS